MTKINVGTIGHVDHGRTTIIAAIASVLAGMDKTLVIEDDRPAMYITAAPRIPDPIDCFRPYDHRKSKGDKKRAKSERRKKWGI